MVRFITRLRSPGRRRLGVCAIATALAPLSTATLAAQLNDTGQTQCFTIAGVAEPCGNGGQDGRYGRDAASGAGAVYKPGAGSAGFDFTKIANSGGTLAANAALGANAGDWAC